MQSNSFSLSVSADSVAVLGSLGSGLAYSPKAGVQKCLMPHSGKIILIWELLSVKCKSARSLLHFCINCYISFTSMILILLFFWNNKHPCSFKTWATFFYQLQLVPAGATPAGHPYLPVGTLVGTLPTLLTPSLHWIFPSVGLWDGNLHITCMNYMQLSKIDCLNSYHAQSPIGTHLADDGWQPLGHTGQPPVPVLAPGALMGIDGPD